MVYNVWLYLISMSAPADLGKKPYISFVPFFSVSLCLFLGYIVSEGRGHRGSFGPWAPRAEVLLLTCMPMMA